MTDFEYKLELPHDPDDGLIMQGDGPLLYTREGGWQQVSVVHNFHCNRSAPGPDPERQITFDMYADTIRIVIEYETIYGCPEHGQTPPTPTPAFEPDCRFESRIHQNTSFGIDMDLSTINNGPYGNRHTMIVDYQPKVLYYQPCGWGRCPLSGNCPGEDFSSVWLCSFNGKALGDCTSYGLQQNESDIEVIHNNEWNGIAVEYHHPHIQDRSSHIVYKCDDTIPRGYVVPEHAGDLVSGHFTLEVGNKDVCVQYMPPPGP
jgi:hypothetical protein